MASPEPTSPAEDTQAPIPIFVPTLPDGEIWNKKEKAILQKHVKHYKGLLKKEKKAYLSSTVIREIKKCFGNRYRKKTLSRNKDISAEWNKKKYVSTNLLVGNCI